MALSVNEFMNMVTQGPKEYFKAQQTTPASGNTTLPADPTRTVITPTPSGATQPINIGTWAQQQGLNVGWDPSTQTVKLGGASFNAGQLPGTYRDEAGQHYVTNSRALSEAIANESRRNTFNGTGKTPNSLLDGLVGMLLQAIGGPSISAVDTMRTIESIVGSAPTMPEQVSDSFYLPEAQAIIEPLYQSTVRDVMGKLAQDQITRGFYGQLPADVVTQQARADLEVQKNRDIADMARQINQSKMGNAVEIYKNQLGQYSNKMAAAIQAVQSANAADAGKLESLMALAKFIQGGEQFDKTFGLEEKKTNASIDSAKVDEALARTEMFGYVLPQDSGLLGLEAGTPSERATEFWASLNARGSGGGGYGGKSSAADDALDSMMDIEMAVASGKISAEQGAAMLSTLQRYGHITADQQAIAYEGIRTDKGGTGATTKEGGTNWGDVGKALQTLGTGTNIPNYQGVGTILRWLAS